MSTMSESFDSIVVLDFEATCDQAAQPEPQEIIEFPSVLVSLTERRIVDEFSSFVRPVHHPGLSDFCTELTSIEQEDVDAAPVFDEVFAAHRRWLTGHGLLSASGDDLRPFRFVTCGDWDLATMLPRQCAASRIALSALPRAYRRWINIKAIFTRTLGVSRPGGMPNMLRTLGLTLQGRHHRGIDDCRNIARIALELSRRGASFETTSRVPGSRYPELPLVLVLGSRTRRLVLRKRALSTLLGVASSAFSSRVVRAKTEDGRLIDDDLLAELEPQSVVILEPHQRARGRD